MAKEFKIYNNGFFRKVDDLWIEKYRPKKLEDYIASKEFKEKIEGYFEEQNIPSLLFEGFQGTGKSAIANIIVRHIDCDFKYINASNENSIETVRNKILEFCTSSSFKPIKIIILDEADYLTLQAQASLRALLEQYSKDTRFILTCNYVERIIGPLRSRCQEYKVVAPTKDFVKKTCLKILKEENVTFEEEELDSIIKSCYPDNRKIIQLLQQQTRNGILKLDKEFFKLLQYQKKILEIIKNSNSDNIYDKVNEIRQLLTDSRVKQYTELYRFLYDNIDEYKRKDENVVKIIIILADRQATDATVADKEINMVACLIQLLEAVNG